LPIKPAVKENFFYATGAKAWRAQTIDELRQIYRKAARRIPPEEILVQQIIRGMEANSFLLRLLLQWVGAWQYGRPAVSPASARIRVA
jgi:predicted ATP-grasp superfamily ATP-dependent carboligase